MNTALKKLLPGARRAQLLTDKQKHARREAVKGPCRLLPSRGARLRALWLRAAAPAKQSRAQPACSAGRGERPLRSHGTAEPAPPAPPYPLRTAARGAPCPPRRSRRCGAWESRASPRSPSPPPAPTRGGRKRNRNRGRRRGSAPLHSPRVPARPPAGRRGLPPPIGCGEASRTAPRHCRRRGRHGGERRACGTGPEEPPRRAEPPAPRRPGTDGAARCAVTCGVGWASGCC